MATILFVTTRIPYPPREGHQIRSYNLLKSACRVHDVHLLSFARKDEGDVDTGHLEGLCASVNAIDIPLEHRPMKWLEVLTASAFTERPFVVHKYHSPEMERRIVECIERNAPELVHFDMLPLAQYRNCCRNLPVVLNEHNVESLLLERRAEASLHSLPVRRFLASQARKLRGFESRACRSADRVLSCSPEDASLLRSLAGECSVDVIPNGVDVEYFVPGTPSEHDPYEMVFVGGMGWFPNRDGMTFFLHEVMPLVCERFPQAHCTIVGNSDGLAIPAGLTDKVRLTGFVEDLRPWVQRAGVYVLPLRVGSGTRLKLLEAMAMAKPVVSTPVGCEGVAVTHERELLMAEHPAEMANAIVRLMQEPDLALRLGERARRKVMEMYDWRVIGERLLTVYRGLLEQRWIMDRCGNG